MKVEQIYQLMNNVTGEVLGKSDLISEDLSKVVDVGTEIFNSSAVDAYVKSLLNHIGRVIFVNRAYSGSAPSVLMDGWEYGSVCEKIQSELPDATENESWELTDGTSYNQDTFYKPSVSAKFYNDRVTLEVPVSFAEMQVKQSFSNAAQLNGFLSMIFNGVDKSMTIKLDALVMRTINNMIGETIVKEYAGEGDSVTNTQLAAKSGVRAVNLLYLYNQRFGTTLTADKALITPEFIRYATYVIGVYISRMATISTMFNMGAKARFTARDLMHIVLLSDFRRASDVYLQADTFNEEYTRLPQAEEVAFWQGSGTAYNFSSISAINIKTAQTKKTVNVSGILGVIFDRDALGVSNLDRRTTTHYNARAEFYSNWYKFDAGYFNDGNENFVVFFVA